MKKTISPVLRPAPPLYPIHPLIAGRWSSRAIDANRNVEAASVERLLEAARWAPSAFNNQPWRFMVFNKDDAAALERSRGVLFPLNSWALAAPVLMFTLARKDRPDSEATNPRALYEAGMAAVLMAVQAAEEGLVFHQMAGFDEALFRERFSVQDRFAVIAAVAIGLPGSPEGLPEPQRVMEEEQRTRRPIDELVFFHGRAPKA